MDMDGMGIWRGDGMGIWMGIWMGRWMGDGDMDGMGHGSHPRPEVRGGSGNAAVFGLLGATRFNARKCALQLGVCANAPNPFPPFVPYRVVFLQSQIRSFMDSFTPSFPSSLLSPILPSTLRLQRTSLTRSHGAALRKWLVRSLCVALGPCSPARQHAFFVF